MYGTLLSANHLATLITLLNEKECFPKKKLFGSTKEHSEIAEKWSKCDQEINRDIEKNYDTFNKARKEQTEKSDKHILQDC